MYLFQFTDNLQKMLILRTIILDNEKIMNENKILMTIGIVLLAFGLIVYALIIVIGSSVYDLVWFGYGPIFASLIFFVIGLKSNRDRKKTK